MKRVADHLVKCLENLEVKYIFSVSGNQIMPVYDALFDTNIQLIHVRHEAAAVHMADAWGRLTATPGVALLAAGPGFANSLSASYVAQMAESPIVILSGHAPVTQFKGGFQKLSQVDMASAVAKASWCISDGQNIQNDIQDAFELATAGRPGPVHLALPFDLLNQETNTVLPNPLFSSDKQNLEEQAISEVQLRSMLENIAKAQKPLILLGPALMRSSLYTSAIANLDIPVIAMESPRGIRDPSLGQFSNIIQEADLLILMGKKLDFTLIQNQTTFITKGTKLIQVDNEASVLELTILNAAYFEMTQLIHGNPEKALEYLIVHSKGNVAWNQHVFSATNIKPSKWENYQTQRDKGLHAASIGKQINDYFATKENSIFISDGGEFCQWMQAMITAKHRIINGPSGAIGSALPFALAARLAYPEASIVACSGDGAFGFHPFEFDTALRYNLPFTFVIGNDALWNAEYQIQQRDYGAERIHGVDLNQSDYHKAVGALGAWGQYVDDEISLKQALKDAEASALPACINVLTRPEAAP